MATKTKERIEEARPYVERALKDEELRDNLKKTIEELRTAADRVQGKKDHGARNAMLLLAGLTIGILYNPATGPQTRQWLKEKVLGPEEDFTYGGSSPSPPTEPPAA